MINTTTQTYWRSFASAQQVGTVADLIAFGFDPTIFGMFGATAVIRLPLFDTGNNCWWWFGIDRVQSKCTLRCFSPNAATISNIPDFNNYNVLF